MFCSLSKNQNHSWFLMSPLCCPPHTLNPPKLIMECRLIVLFDREKTKLLTLIVIVLDYNESACHSSSLSESSSLFRCASPYSLSTDELLNICPMSTYSPLLSLSSVDISIKNSLSARTPSPVLALIVWVHCEYHSQDLAKAPWSLVLFSLAVCCHHPPCLLIFNWTIHHPPK